MKPTADLSTKPKPGYVARQQPAKVRGISISQQGATSSISAMRSLPPPPAPPEETWARALETFDGADSRELSFKKGDLIRILHQDPSGWWSAEKDHVLGYAPSTYLEIVPTPKPTGGRKPSHVAPLPGKR